MKKVYRVLTALVGAALFAGVLCFAACGKKKETAALTLEAGDGGTIGQTVYDVEVGASLPEFVKDIAPTPEEGLEFAGWYLDGEALPADASMPAEGATLTAKYYASYTVNLYLQTVTGEYGAAQTTSGKAIYGEAFSVSPSEAHFVLDDTKENKLSTEKLAKNDSFTAYLARETIYVVYHVNAPAGSDIADAVRPLVSRYGAEVAIGGGEAYGASGIYRFAGWSQKEEGPAEYFGGETVTLEQDLNLYAVWDVGYTDHFGGGDIIFFPQADATQAVLVRAGVEHIGTRNGDAFSFKADGKEILKGKVSADGQFTYFRDAQKNVVYRHMNDYTGALHLDLATLTFDGEGGATYTEGTTTQKGTLEYDPATMYYSFHGADNKGFYFVLSEYGEEKEKVFVRIGAEEGAYTSLTFTYDGTEEGVAQAMMLEAMYLDGRGVVIVYDLSSGDYDVASPSYVGDYVPDETNENEIDLYLQDVNNEGAESTRHIKLMEYLGDKVYVNYNPDFDTTFTATDGATLTLDGYGGTYESAVYTPMGGDAIHGEYILTSSYDGVLVRLIDAEKHMYFFHVNGTECKALGAEHEEYMQYYGFAGSWPIGAPVLVFGADDSVTYIDSDRTEKTGTVTAVAGKEGRFAFSADGVSFEYELGGDYYNIDGIPGYYSYYIYYPVKTTSNNVTELSDGNGGKVVYVSDGDNYSARYIPASGKEMTGVSAILPGTQFGLTFDILEFIDIQTRDMLLFGLVKGTEETYTSFINFGGESGVYFPYGEADGFETSEYLMLFKDAPTGTESATQNVAILMDTSSSSSSKKGTYTLADGLFTATFPDEEVRYFKIVEGDEGTGYVEHTDLWEGSGAKRFETTDHSAWVELDGFGFATYHTASGEVIADGECTMGSPIAENTYRVYITKNAAEGFYEAYVDIDLAASTMSAVDYIFGTYTASDNSGDMIVIDGHGVAILYNIEKRQTDGTLIPQKEGSYTVVRNDESQTIVRVTFGDGADKETFDALLYSQGSGEDKAYYYTVANKAAGTYRSASWELFTFDEFGNAVYTDVYGISYEGTCTLLSEHVASFESDTLDAEPIFKLASDGTFTRLTEGFVTDGTLLLKYLGGEEDANGKVTIPDDITEIAPSAFSEHELGSRYRGADIKELDLKNVERIGANAFNGCILLTKVTGNNVTFIGANAFYACIELVTIDFPKVETIGEMAFHLCESLEEVTLDTAKVIYSSAFSGCSSLTLVSLEGIERLFEGVFFECESLEYVLLGSHVTQIGTPDEPVAGVFEGISTPFVVRIEATEVPTVGVNAFPAVSGVKKYTIALNNIDVVKKYYKVEAWKEYNSNVGTKSDYDGTYYWYNYGAQPYVFNGLIWEVSYGATVLGSYSVDDQKQLTLYTFNFTADGADNFTSKPKGKFKDGVFLYDRNGCGLSDEANLYCWVKAGTEITFTASGQGGGTLTFTPAADGKALNAPEKVYSVDGTWTVDDAPRAVKVEFEHTDQYYSPRFSMLYNGDRYTLSASADITSKTVSIGSPVFEPIVTVYTAADESYLALSQNNREATEYTASAVIANEWTDEGTPFTLTKVAVTKGADGKTFTMKETVDFHGEPCKFVFTINEAEESFTYTVVKAEPRAFTIENKARVTVYRMVDGTITSIKLERYTVVDVWSGVSDWEEVTKDFFREQTGDTYVWYVCDYKSPLWLTLTLSGSGEDWTGELKEGKAIGGYLSGKAYATVFVGEGGSIERLYMKAWNGSQYEKINSAFIEDKTDHFEVEFYDITYSLTVGDSSITLVAYNYVQTYEGTEWVGGGTVEGSVEVTYEAGAVKSLKLKLNGGEYTEYTEKSGRYLFVVNEEKYLVKLNSSDCDIYKLEKHQFTVDAETVTVYVIKGSNEIIESEKVTATGLRTETVHGEDYLHFEVSGKEYLGKYSDHTVEEVKEETLTTADGEYQLKLKVTDSGLIYKMTEFSMKNGGAELQRYSGAYLYSTSGDDGRTHEVDVTVDDVYTCFYFKIEKGDSGWTLEYKADTRS